MVKKSFTKRLVSKVLVPVTKKYLEKDRDSKFLNMDLHIPKGVFHPSFFLSTKTMCRFLSTIDISEKKIMEIGCGSGAISIHAAKLGATVFCSDINPLAVKTTQQNAERNGVIFSVIESDLFKAIPEKNFDIILNNPPYYPKDPANLQERAWYAGSNLEYFKKFFNQSSDFLKNQGIIYMVLSNDCDLRQIDKIAAENSFTGKLVYQRPNLLEKSFVMSYHFHQ
jgi:release factor glutamine methyltransferase